MRRGIGRSGIGFPMILVWSCRVDGGDFLSFLCFGGMWEAFRFVPWALLGASIVWR